MESMDWLLRHRRTKVAETDRPIANDGRSLPSTLPFASQGKGKGKGVALKAYAYLAGGAG